MQLFHSTLLFHKGFSIALSSFQKKEVECKRVSLHQGVRAEFQDLDIWKQT
jgi:hypothetical protein